MDAKPAEPPPPIVLPPTLQAAIKQLVPSEDPLDQPNFNSIEYINALFPTEQSLSDINDVISKLKQKVANTEREIGHQVRAQSGTTHRGQRDVEYAKASIQDLFTKINDIKKKAEHSERMVEELCSGIKTLDTAKQHLRATVAALRRLHMMVTGVSQLKELVATKQFRECANLLQGVNELSSHFEKYKGVPKIAELNAEVQTARDALIQLVNHEFTQERSQHLTDAALVIDAMGPSQKAAFITWFCTRELDEYRRGFRSDDESAKLEYTERRFFWMKKAWQRFDDSFANVFPASWRMGEHVTEEFAFLTREQLLQELDRRTSKDTLDVAALIRALKKTIDFEKEVAERYQATPLEDLSADTKDVKDEMAQDGDMRTVIGMRSNWRKFYRQRMRDMMAVLQAPRKANEDEEEEDPDEAEERQQQMQLLQNEVKSLRWKGIISQAFDGYLRPYIQDQDRHMGERFDQNIKAETWLNPETERSKYLSSAVALINYFQDTLPKISELTRGKAFFEVFQLFKKYYGQYCSILASKLPTMPATGPLKLAEKDERTVCLIINTAEWCGVTTVSLTERIRDRIDSKWKESVDLSEERENFMTVVANGIKLLVAGLEGKLEPALMAMTTRVPWGTLEATGDQSEYVTTTCTTLSQTVILYDQLLSAKHFGFFCDKFITAFCPHLKANIYNCKRFSVEGAEQLQIDMHVLKTFLHDLPVLPSNVQAANSLLPVQPRTASKQYLKLLKKQMEQIEMFSKVLSTPPELLVNNYKGLIGEGSEADFVRVMELKGVQKKEQQPLLERFRHASGNAKPSDQSGNFRRLLSFTSDLL